MRSVVLVVLVAIFAREPASACSCIRFELKEAFEMSKVVVVASVRERLDDRDLSSDRVFDIQVEGVWKGDARYAMKITTGQGGGDCGRGNIVKEQRWIFFAHQDNTKMLYTSICDASHLATKEAIAKMTKTFGAPKNPKK